MNDVIDTLADHAMKNVWCTPDQDKQGIMKLARITADGGAVSTVNVMWRKYNLPTTKDRYHIYQLGQRNPIMFGIEMVKDEWQSFPKVALDNKVVMDLYLNNGIRYPTATAFMLYTKDQALILAVKIHDKIDTLDTEYLYLRLYKNAYFASSRSDTNPETIKIVGGVVTSLTSIAHYQAQVLNYRKQVGGVTCFVNGEYVGIINPTTAKVGDYVEYVYDSTIKFMVDIHVDDLPVFDSDLDNLRKYLVHYALPAGQKHRIEFYDDIDIWMIQPGKGYKVGRFYHHNRAASIRMVTHRDYSIPVNYVVSYLANNPGFGTLDTMVLRIVVRNSGYDRPLVYENSRIHELYKLPDSKIKAAMVGPDSNVPFWRAAALEQSDYVKLMSADYSAIKDQLVVGAYGYNASTFIVANSPVDTTANGANKLAILPYGCRDSATINEFDANGNLLGWGHHTYGDTWICKSNKAAMIEAIPSIGGNTLDRQEGGYQHKVLSTRTYRHYLCSFDEQGNPDRIWRNVTGTDKYMISQGLVIWDIDTTTEYALTLSDALHLQYDFTITPNDSLLQFSINEFRGGSKLVLDIALGNLDLWMNKKHLIRGLDYVCDFPRITVFNKEYRVEGANRFTLRASGFSEDGASFREPDDYGFVQYGVLSKNTTFDLRDDRVCRISVGGGIKRKSDLKFAENRTEVGISTQYNGRPYVVESVYVPLRSSLGIDTTALELDAIARDGVVKAYMSVKFPDVKPTKPSMIPDKYMLVSPVCSKIISDLQNDRFIGNYRARYSDSDVRDWFVKYQDLLSVDPIQLGIDLEYVSVHPHEFFHVINLDIQQYLLVEKISNIFLSGKVDLAQFVAVV